jgi:DNA invertase Pin-like site-specific DNA recombinase
VATETQTLSHSELIKAGIQRKKEAIEKGEVYIPRSRRKSNNVIGRPKLKVSDLPKNFVELYTLKQYKNISDLARKANLSRTTVYRYIDVIENR